MPLKTFTSSNLNTIPKVAEPERLMRQPLRRNSLSYHKARGSMEILGREADTIGPRTQA